jgi:hypothetical protein
MSDGLGFMVQGLFVGVICKGLRVGRVWDLAFWDLGCRV